MKGNEMLQAVVGAVNAYVSTNAAVTASPGISIWTTFLLHSMKKAGSSLKITAVRCRPSLTRSAWFGVFGHRSKEALSALTDECARDKGMPL